MGVTCKLKAAAEIAHLVFADKRIGKSNLDD